jgi:creatinine amidohydrolase
MTRRVDVLVPQSMVGEAELLDHRRRPEREVVAVADVDRGAGEVLAGRRAADLIARFDEYDRKSGAGEVGRGDQPVVAGADDDRVTVVVRATRSGMRHRPILYVLPLRSNVTGVSRRLADLRAPQLADALDERSILVQPLGAIEQHGPHLPFSTDLLIAERVADAAVDRVGADLGVWVLPALAYTKSNEHAWSSGTIWLSADTLLRVLDDIGRCVATTPARKLVFFNGHGGNSSLLSVANREVRLAHGLQTFLTHPGVPPDQGGLSAPEELGMGVHGGTDETSMMLHLAPELVDMSLATRNVPEQLASNKYVRFGGKVGFGWLSNDFGPDGHIGDPTSASAEHGAALFEAAVVAFAEALAEIAVFDFGR